MAYRIDPIIECNLNEGTTFTGPLEGHEVIWTIVSRELRYLYVATNVNGNYVEKKYSVTQFGYLMCIKKIFHFVEVKL